jgi:hypothetical protein
VWAQIMYGNYETFAFLLAHEFLWYCCIPPCEMHFLLVRWWCWIFSYDACELWISVNLDAESNFCEFSHILADFRMQPLMAAKSWLDRGCIRQAGSRLL